MGEDEKCIIMSLEVPIEVSLELCSKIQGPQKGCECMNNCPEGIDGVNCFET